MKERPILFKGAMVRAILDGTKTQTRREVNWKRLHKQAGLSFPSRCKLAWFTLLNGWGLDAGDAVMRAVACPYGQPGDLLWVRETFAPFDDQALAEKDPEFIFYRADDEAVHECDGKWKPSIFMPRWASRITLEIVSVRVERLNEISRGDSMAEGCPFPNMATGEDPRGWYSELWEKIKGAGSWAANPWVWVVEFKRVQL